MSHFRLFFFPRYYVDVTTNQINTGTGVTGTNNNFQVNINPISLNPKFRWYMQLTDFQYNNADLTGQVRPIVLCNIIKPMRENNTFSNILFKGSNYADNSVAIIDGVGFGNPIIVEVENLEISTIQFDIVRSDNGQPFPFPNDGSAVILTVAFFREE